MIYSGTYISRICYALGRFGSEHLEVLEVRRGYPHIYVYQVIYIYTYICMYVCMYVCRRG
jgi:hypothetical protein